MAPATVLTRLAVFGSPIKHSLSPRIHAKFAEQAGIPVDYTAIEVSEDFLSREVQKLADEGGKGCNITMPLKNRAFLLANQHSDRATMAEAANTLVFKSPTRWYADSTDGPGLICDLKENLGITLENRKICIIGAGGASAGIIYDLLLQQPAKLAVFNRTADRAHALAERFSEHGEVITGSMDDMAGAEPFDLVINATSAGHFRKQPVLEASLFVPGSVCYDLSYGVASESTDLWCKAHDIRFHDGLGMLVEQAAASFEIWTGFKPDTAPVYEGLRNES
jgi:shikimate dehydrogenase